jgi:competence protein ComEC
LIIDDLQRHPFLRLLMPLAGGILCGDAFPHVFPMWLCLAGFLLLLFVFVLCRYWYSRWLYGVTVYFFLFGLGFQLVSRQLEQTEYTFPNKPSVYKVCIREKPEVKERSILCRVSLEKELRQDTVIINPRNNLFLLYFPKDSAANGLQQGDELLIHARLSPPSNNGNPDEFDYARYLRRKGGSGTAYIPAGHWKVVGHNASRTLRQTALEYREKIVSLYRNSGFKGDELAVLSALTVGDKEELSDDIVETYSVAGASHVLALSGLHIGFLYALLWLLMSPLWKRWRCLKPILLLLIILFLWSFAFLTGLSSSVVRSVIMFSLLALAGLQPEKPLTINTLAGTAFLMLLYNPVWLFDVGFQLSFSAVAAILLFQPKLYALWKVENRPLRYLWGLITVSVAAQLGTAPLVILYFSRFSTHFLLTNLWVIPMVSLILYSSVFFLVLTPFPFLQHAFASVLEALVRTQNSVLQWIEQLPSASVDGIWTDVWEVLLFYLFLGWAYTSLTRRTIRNVYAALFALLLLVSYHSVSTISNAPHRSIAFYNVRGCPVVHCMTNGSRSWLACADSLPDISRLQHVLSPYWNRLRLDTPQLITGDYSTPNLSVRNQIVSYADKRICLLHDARWQYKISSRPVSIDYLYISKGYKGRIADLTSLFSIGTVVLDASLSAYYQERIINDCIRLGLPHLSLSEKGSIRILL